MHAGPSHHAGRHKERKDDFMDVESAESKRKKNLRRDASLPPTATVAFLYFSHRRNKSNLKITDYS